MAPTSNPSAPGPGRRGPAIATPPLDTSNAAKTNKRYSYTDTPMEMQAPKFNYPITSPTNSTIDESPITPASPSSRVLPIYTEPATQEALVREEKAHVQQLQQPPPPLGVHPAYFAPYIDDSQKQRPPQKAHQQQQLHPPTENGTHPGVSITAPTPLSPTSPRLPSTQQYQHRQQQVHTNGTSNRLTPQPTKPPEPKKPPQPAAAVSIASTTIVPDTYAPPPTFPTPDITPSTHLPGQIPHRNTNTSQHWRHGLCEPSALCCLSLFLPCLVYGKTQYRLNRKMAHEDPTNLLGYESCNGACGLFALACGFQGVLAAIQRSRIRKAYEIEGDIATDCLKGLCCCCCVVGQDEREMKEREEARGGGAGGTRAATGAYLSPGGGMAYAPPPR